jgi:hypothetical protein
MRTPMPIKLPAAITKFIESEDVAIFYSVLLNMLYLFVPLFNNKLVLYYIVLSVLLASSFTAYNAFDAKFSKLYHGNLILGFSFLWHSLLTTFVPESMKIVIIVCMITVTIVGFTTGYRDEALFVQAAFWLVPFDTYILIAPVDLQLMIILYTVFWVSQEIAIPRLWKVEGDYILTIVATLPMFRMFDVPAVIYTVAAHSFKSYLLYKKYEASIAPPEDMEKNLNVFKPGPEEDTELDPIRMTEILIHQNALDLDNRSHTPKQPIKPDPLIPPAPIKKKPQKPIPTRRSILEHSEPVSIQPSTNVILPTPVLNPKPSIVPEPYVTMASKYFPQLPFN